MASKASRCVTVGEVPDVKNNLITIVGSGSYFIDEFRGRVSVIALCVEDYATKRELLDNNNSVS
jgi:hypothetical protein